MNLDTYVPPAADSVGDNLNPTDVLNRTLVIQPLKMVEQVPTKFGTKDALAVNVADIAANQTFCSVLWFNGPLIDALKNNIGGTIAVRLERNGVSKSSGHTWVTVARPQATSANTAASFCSIVITSRLINAG